MKLHGLQKAAERNGQVGVISSYDESRSRYMVQLRDGAGGGAAATLALKADNLLQMLGVKLRDLEGAHAQHNGADATLFEWDAEASMYGVELPPPPPS